MTTVFSVFSILSCAAFVIINALAFLEIGFNLEFGPNDIDLRKAKAYWRGFSRW